MSLECADCERDLRGGHATGCRFAAMITDERIKSGREKARAAVWSGFFAKRPDGQLGGRLEAQAAIDAALTAYGDLERAIGKFEARLHISEVWAVMCLCACVGGVRCRWHEELATAESALDAALTAVGA